MEIESRLKYLLQHLYQALETPLMKFDETKTIKSCGIYIIYNSDNAIIYVGKTTRTGKSRLRELTS